MQTLSLSFNIPTSNDIAKLGKNIKETVTSKKFIKTALQVAAIATLAFASVATGALALTSLKATTAMASSHWAFYYLEEIVFGSLATGMLATTSSLLSFGAIKEVQQLFRK